MTLRSGKKILGPEPVIPKDKDEKKIENELEKEDSNGADPKDKEKEILEVFRKVEINIPLLDAIKQVSKYAKFLRDLCVNRRRLTGDERIIVGENVSAVLQRKLPPKCGNPDMFTFPCRIGNTVIRRAMLDLGASINVMPKSIYASLKLGPLKETGIIIQLADRTNAYSDGLVEDVLVKVNDLVLPADFYVFDMDDDHSPDLSPLLLGRPFMSTAQTKIDINKGTLSMEFDEKIVHFNIFDTMKYPSNFNFSSVFSVSAIDHAVQEVFKTVGRDELEVALTKHLELETTPEEEKLIRVLREHKEAIDWTIADIKRISPSICMHRIRFEEYAKPVRQAQRRLNPLMMEVVKKEILKLLDVRIIFAISDSSWVSPVQIAIAPEDQEKTTFTCPFGTFAYRRMPFGLCNASATFQRCMGIDVDKDKINIISALPYPTSVREVRSFLGHAGFYRKFIKDFSKIGAPLFQLLQKDVTFEFDDKCEKAFNKLKELLTSPPIIQPPVWSLLFEIMCDASDHAVGAVMGQRVGKAAHVIYYASRDLNGAQLNYSTTEKEFLAIIFALEKFRSYLLGAKVIVFFDHATLRYLMTKKDAKPRLIRWILLLQEFDLEIRDKKGSENLVADHLSRIPVEEENEPLKDAFPEKHLFSLNSQLPWYADLVNYLVMGNFPAVDYVSKWVEGKATQTNNSKVVADFIRSNIFVRFGMPRAIVSDREMHFYNNFN
ncbi:uncharacterized protein [Coffea arabica]|uniref:RNA-directed DNA polymerase n=1 Tax=Coffea arabica TaxID=13443 RepID=A0ABM4X9K0_COFAR